MDNPVKLWITTQLRSLIPNRKEQNKPATITMQTHTHNYDECMGERLAMTQARDALDALTQACQGITQQLGDDSAPLLAFQIVVILGDGTTLVAQGENLGLS